MQTIHKYKIEEITDLFEIEMPRGAKVLTVQLQQGTPCIWAQVDPKQPMDKRQFRLAGTGHPLDESTRREYIGSFQMSNETLIFHLFAIGGR